MRLYILPEARGEVKLAEHLSKQISVLGAKLEDGSVLNPLFEAMKYVARSFHGYDHFDFMSSMPPEQVKMFLEQANIKDDDFAKSLCAAIGYAGAVHDIVYLNADGGVNNPKVKDVISLYCEDLGNGNWKIKEDIKNTPFAAIVAEIYGFAPGHKFEAPQKQNEFLSALYGAHLLHEKGGSLREIAMVATITEPTIPFRPQQAYIDLHKRLKKVNSEHDLGLDETQMKSTMKGAVFLANKDIYGFCGFEAENLVEALKNYLQGTWNLMPEMNASLRGGTEITPQIYRGALQGNMGFINLFKNNIINVENIFHSFDGYPSEEKMTDLTSKAHEIINQAELYLKTKIVASSLIESISAKSGTTSYSGDGINISIRTLVGGVEEFLKAEKEAHHHEFAEAKNGPTRTTVTGLLDPANRIDEPVLQVLFDRGGRVPFGFDTSGSPIAHFLTQMAGFETINKLYEHTKLMSSADKGSPDERVKAAESYFSEAAKLLPAEAMFIVLQSVKDVANSNEHTKHRAPIIDELSQNFAAINQRQSPEAKSLQGESRLRA
jgi:hypothetical protein